MFFSEMEDIDFRSNGNITEELLKISTKYIADNPAEDFVLRMCDGDGFYYDCEHGYVMNFKERFPNAPCGSWVYATAKTVMDFDIDLNLVVGCYGPLEIYCNGELVFVPSLHEAVDVDKTSLVTLPLKKGENSLFIKALAAKNGFGCRLAAENTCWGWMEWLSPFTGFCGFSYTEPIDKDIFGKEIPEISEKTRDSFSFKWLPEKKTVKSECDFFEMFDEAQKGYLYAWSGIESANRAGEMVSFSIKATDDVRLWIDGSELKVSSSGDIKTAETHISYGKHDVVISYSYKTSLKFSVSSTLEFKAPRDVYGMEGNWLYLGALKEEADVSGNKIYCLFNGADDDSCYWRADYKKGFVRLCLESEHFGKWTYPIGVAMYGLISVARMTGRTDIAEYVERHVKQTANSYRYSMWDRKKFGHPEINNEISRMELLDDCGSFGSSMLEVFGAKPYEDIKYLASKIAEYMTEINPTQENGAFYRLRKGHYVNNTLWADDLYMSVPFLCRYYRLTGDEKYIEIAAKQFMLYKEYLFLPEYRIMSHIYDFKYNTMNGIPWGRGNGWVLFSLSELLSVIPKDFDKRDDLLTFYRELCSGYLALQGENGLWHQVLIDEESYEETSCTSMFVYAFSRGLTEGWLDKAEEEAYFKAACKGWKGITSKMIDRFGNVYGVCQGSGYSFLFDYYKNSLRPLTNDIHGIGIVLLAGVALKKLLDKE